jgi:alpha-beta hydrolase superfamily lysophospholipase
MKAIGPEIRGLPVYGVGHSLGSLLTLLVNSRFAVHRDGNALLSFNNLPATDVIPFLSPLLAPGTRALGPVLSQVRFTSGLGGLMSCSA